MRLAIDDFGAAASSLSQLQRLPIARIKLDPQHVAALPGDPTAQSIAKVVLGIGRAMGLSVLAEGVETPEQARRPKALGCVEAPGYLLGRPVAPGELELPHPAE